MFARIVVVAFQHVAERHARLAVNQVAIHGSVESLELAPVPRRLDLRVLNIACDLQTCALEMSGMKFRLIIDNNYFWCAVAFPPVLNRREFAREMSLRQNRVFEAPHHRQTTWRFEASIAAG